MDASVPDPDRPFPLWRWLRWYPLVAAVGVALLWWLVPRGSQQPGEQARRPEQVTPASERAVEADIGVAQAAEKPLRGARSGALLTRGRDGVVALEGAAVEVAGAIGRRFSAGIGSLRERVGREELERGGLTAARLTPFLGPYLRYLRARDLFASGEAELQDRARRQTVIALVELSLDVGAAGLGHAGEGAQGLLQAMEGVVEAADFADFALSLHAELGAPLGFAGLDSLDAKVDDLAGTALDEIDGLEPFIDELLVVEPPEWLESLPPELLAEARELLAPK